MRITDAAGAEVARVPIGGPGSDALGRELDVLFLDELGPLGDVGGEHLAHLLGAAGAHHRSGSKRARTSGMRHRLLDRVLDGTAASFGVPAGAKNPIQVLTS